MTEEANTAYEVRDGDRTYTFTGRLLGEATSLRAGPAANARRWTEVRIFRTDAGSYVVEVVGRSTMPGEVDLCRSHISLDAAGAVECLHGYDDDGVRYLTHTARRAATAAADEDETFRAAFLTEHVA